MAGFQKTGRKAGKNTDLLTVPVSRVGTQSGWGLFRKNESERADWVALLSHREAVQKN